MGVIAVFSLVLITLPVFAGLLGKDPRSRNPLSWVGLEERGRAVGASNQNGHNLGTVREVE